MEKKKMSPKYLDLLNQACEYLSYISFMRKFNLIKVFEQDDIDRQDIEETIIKAVFDSYYRAFKTNRDYITDSHSLTLFYQNKKGQKGVNFENLKLALEWNRIDLVAKNGMFSVEKSLSSEEMSKLLEKALVENKVRIETYHYP
jgi:hypothetical protein